MVSLERSNQAVNQLLNANEEFRELYEEHDDLETRVIKMTQQKITTAEDEVELQRLKKIELAGKDRMVQILGEAGHNS